ncbi:glycosyltransferase [bacterium]|nr:glycosyltransferase [bacterium]
MRILMLNTEKGFRGGERQTLYMMQALRELNLQVELLCRRDTPVELEARAAGLRVYPLTSHLLVPAFLATYGKRFDIIHAQTGRTQSVAVLTRPFHHRPVVYTRRVDFRLKPGFSRWKYRHTDAIVAISRAIEEILANAGVSASDVIPSVVQQRPLDEERAHALRRELLGGRRRFLPGTVAALVPHKDPLTMVEAVAALRQRRDDFAFVHFGDGALRPQVEEAIREAGLEGIYHLQGHVEQVEDFYSVLHLFVMSSREEGLGSAVLDAFQYGVPVVATSAGGLRETVAGRGVLVNPEQPEELSRAMDDLLNDETRRRTLADTARRDIRHLYHPDTAARRYHELYLELLAQKG